MRFLVCALVAVTTLLSPTTTTTDALRISSLQQQLAAATTTATSNYILWSIDGIKQYGKSDSTCTDCGFLNDLQFGVSMPLTSGPSNTSRASGRSVWQDITVTRDSDLTSPTLMLKCAGGDDIKTMFIQSYVQDPAGKMIPGIKTTYESVIITKFNTAYDTTQGKFIDTVSFSFKKMTYDASPPANAPATTKKNTMTWSLEENKGK